MVSLASDHEAQDKVDYGIYYVNGYSSDSPVTDDGILISYISYQFKVGIHNAKFAVRASKSSEWIISQ